MRDHAGAQMIVEFNFAVCDAVFKVYIRGIDAAVVVELCQRQVMRCQQPHGIGSQQPAHDARRSDTAIV